MSIYDTGVNNIIKEYEEILNKIFELKNKIKSAFISLNKENLDFNKKCKELEIIKKKPRRNFK